ncbi:hypothetical protein ACOJUR_07385 [Alicyclobacillus tolerans]|uniref:Uncharacterized protein n=2 Tax=Alicyclobacillus tolerans TaxID=90970 RepID=A0A1M6RUC0_9BACL|nr:MULTISPECIES: hypothetical protein [Alicyclobacillus]MDP9729795.1 hypothetical protein [Alicyclobacillus tengchongensis]SHK35988.1 hypothetical protein SAMN05443507_112101 [Alicyclobacillus montanus]
MDKTLKRSRRWLWIVYLLWALFVNAMNLWVVKPLVEDFALLGVLAVIVIIVLWLTTIRIQSRKKWITFTLFALLLGQGISSVSFYPTGLRVLFTVIMLLGLCILAIWFTKAGWKTVLVSAAAILLVNLWLPYSEWPFLTHFKIVKYGKMSLIPGDIPALPWSTISTPQGPALVTFNRVLPSNAELSDLASQATSKPDSLYNLLQTAQHEYELMEILSDHGKAVVKPLPLSDLAQVSLWNLVAPTFPLSVSHWKIVNQHAIMYLTAPVSPASAAALGLEPASYSGNFLALAAQTWEQDQEQWNQLLSDANVTPANPPLQIQGGLLTGSWQGHTVQVPVKTQIILGEGSFTRPGANQVLLEGANLLQIVSLTQNKVVASFHASLTQSLPHDIVIGPLTKGGPDAIFVNAQRAYILSVNSAGQFRTVYEAPLGSSLRFEAVLPSVGNRAPEIITDDPSAMRDVPTRYFSSYLYRDHQLYRNWRVYRTNVVNVEPVHWQPGKVDLALSIYGTGEYLIIQRSYTPVLPVSIGIFIIIGLIGWGLRLNDRRKRVKADEVQ